MRKLLLLVLGLFVLTACSSESGLAQSDIDKIASTVSQNIPSIKAPDIPAPVTLPAPQVLQLDSLIQAAEDSAESVKQTETKIQEFNDQIDSLNPVLESSSEAIGRLEERMDLLAQEMEKLSASMPTSPKELNVVDAFPEIFQNASQVDIISNADFFSCKDYSTFDVKEGDQISVEILFVRNEDMFTRDVNLQPSLEYWRNSSYGIHDVEASFRFEERIVSNPWNDTNKPYVSALYRAEIHLQEAGFFKQIQSKSDPGLIDGINDDVPRPGKAVLYVHPGVQHYIAVHPTADPHPDVPEKYLENYNRDMSSYEDSVAERFERVQENNLHIFQRTKECRENMMTGIVDGTFIVAWYAN